jgi:membrane associated rhomboid family serine protease
MMGLRITGVVKHLLIINVLMFILSNIFTANGAFDANEMLALHYPNSDLFKPYQIITHFFMHGGFAHIAFNMFALVMFGAPLEALWGEKRFLFFYFFCAIGAVVLTFAINYIEYNSFISKFSPDQLAMIQAEGQDVLAKGRNYTDEALANLNIRYYMQQNSAMLGASGAIFGLLLAFGMKFPNVELMLLFLPVPIKAKYFIPILMVIELTMGMANFSWDNVAHFAHLGGALFGFLLLLYWRRYDSGFQH